VSNVNANNCITSVCGNAISQPSVNSNAKSAIVNVPRDVFAGNLPLILLLRMFRSPYPVYCLCVNVYCATANGCQHICSQIHIISSSNGLIPCSFPNNSETLNKIKGVYMNLYAIFHSQLTSKKVKFSMSTP
jgi:hypothetical protein